MRRRTLADTVTMALLPGRQGYMGAISIKPVRDLSPRQSVLNYLDQSLFNLVVLVGKASGGSTLG